LGASGLKATLPGIFRKLAALAFDRLIRIAPVFVDILPVRLVARGHGRIRGGFRRRPAGIPRRIGLSRRDRSKCCGDRSRKYRCTELGHVTSLSDSNLVSLR